MKTFRHIVVMACAAAFAVGAAQSLAQQRPGYGTAVNLETAKKIAAGSIAEARRNNWNVAVAILDNHGMLIYYEMLDDTQTSSATIAIEKGGRLPCSGARARRLKTAFRVAASRFSACPAPPRSRADCRSWSTEKSSAGSA